MDQQEKKTTPEQQKKMTRSTWILAQVVVTLPIINAVGLLIGKWIQSKSDVRDPKAVFISASISFILSIVFVALQYYRTKKIWKQDISLKKDGIE